MKIYALFTFYSYKISKIQPPVFHFLFFYISFYVSRYHLSQLFGISFNINIFLTSFSFLTDSLKPLSYQPKSAERYKSFLLILPNSLLQTTDENLWSIGTYYFNSIHSSYVPLSLKILMK